MFLNDHHKFCCVSGSPLHPKETMKLLEACQQDLGALVSKFDGLTWLNMESSCVGGFGMNVFEEVKISYKEKLLLLSLYLQEVLQYVYEKSRI